jgi:filamentous hemagglutinin
MAAGQAGAAGLPTQGAVDLSVATAAGSLNTKITDGAGNAIGSTAAFTSTGASATVDVSGNARTVINWTTFDVGNGKTLNFTFNNASDIVVNRVSGGSGITVESGGAVNGNLKTGGATGGGIWFLADQGVFIHGTVSASSVVISRALGIEGNLLDPNASLTSLKSSLAAAGSLINLEGVPVATNASIDATGNILLTGDLNVGTGTVDLESIGTLSQSAGVVTASSLTANAAGGVSLASDNLVGNVSVGNTGSGDVTYKSGLSSLTTVASATNSAGAVTLTSDVGDLTLSSVSAKTDIGLTSAGALNLTGDVTAGATNTINLSASGAIGQTGGVLTAKFLTAGAHGGLSLTDANKVTTVSTLTNTGSGDINFVSDGTTTVSSTTSAGGVSLTSNTGDLTVGSVSATDATAGKVSFTAAGAVNVANHANVLVGADYAVTGASFNAEALSVTAPAALTIHGTGSGLDLSATPISGAGNVTVTLDSGDLKVGTVKSTGTGDVKVTSTTGSATVSSATASNGQITLTANHTAELDSGTALSGLITVTGADAKLVTAHADSLNLTANSGNLFVTGAVSATHDLTLSATGSANVTNHALITVGRSYSVTGGSFNSEALAVAPGSGDLTIHGTDTSGVGLDFSGLSFSAPGTVRLSLDSGVLKVGSVTAGGDAYVTGFGGAILRGAGLSGSGDHLLQLQSDHGSVVLGANYGAAPSGTLVSSSDPAHVTSVKMFVGASAPGGSMAVVNLGIMNATLATISDPVGDVSVTVGVGSLKIGALTSGGDIAVSAPGSITLGSANAGDDVVMRAGGNVTATGDVRSGQPFASDTGSGGAGDALASASTLSVFGGHLLTDQTTGSNVNIKAQHISIAGTVEAGSTSASNAQEAGSQVALLATGADQGGAALSLGQVLANQDIALEATSGSVQATGLVAAGRDLAARAAVGNLTLSASAAGDDAVLRTTGAVTVNGTLTSGQTVRGQAFDDNSAGLGDVLGAFAPMTIFGTAPGSPLTALTGGHNIDVRAVQVSITGAAQAGTPLPGGDFTNQFGSDARLVATGTNSTAINVGSVSANQDVGLDVTGAGAGVSAGALTAGRDVAARALQGGLSLSSAAASDDVVLQGSANVSVSGALTSGQAQLGIGLTDGFGLGDQLASISPMSTFAGTLTSVSGGHDVRIQGLHVSVTGATEAGTSGDGSAVGAGSRVVVAATGADSGPASISMGAVSANQDIGLVSSLGSISAGSASAGRDLAAAGGGTINLGASAAGDDVVLRASGGVTVNGTLTSGQTVRGEAFDDTAGLGDALGSFTPMTIFGASNNSLTALTGGHDIDVIGALVSVSGAVQAGTPSPSSDLGNQVGSDVRLVATSNNPTAISVGAVSADQDVGLDVTSLGGGVLAGALTAGRDVAARSSQGALNLVSAAASDDVVLRAGGGVSVSDSLVSGQTQLGIGSFDVGFGLGDQLASISPMSIFGLTLASVSGGSDVSVQGLNVTVTGQTVAGTSGDTSAAGAGSSVVVAATGADPGLASISMGAVSANQDVGLASSIGSISTGSVAAGRDLAVAAGGGTIALGASVAGDDIVLRASGGVTVNGTLTTGQTVRGEAFDDTAGFGDALGAFNSMTIFGTAPGSALTALTGGHSIDVVASQISVTGAVHAGTSSPGGADLANQLGSDVRLVATGSILNAISVGDVSADQDVGLDTTGAAAGVSAGALLAGRDVAVRASQGALSLGSAAASDDVVLRAGGDLSVAGGLTSGQTQLGINPADGFGLGDQLNLVSPQALFNFLSKTVSGGYDVDVVGRHVAITGPVEAGIAGATGDAGQTGSGVAIRAFGADAGGPALSLGDVSANQDIALDASSNTGGSISGGTLSAGRDVAVNSAAAGVSLSVVHAGDDVVLRAPGGDLIVSSSVTSGQTVRGMAIDDDAGGLGDALAAISPIGMFMSGPSVTDMTHGHDVNLQAVRVQGGFGIEAGTSGPTLDFSQIHSRVLVSASGVFKNGHDAISLGDVSANEDVALSAVGPGGAGVTAGNVTAGRDVAVFGGIAGMTLASVAAGDDAVLRSNVGLVTVNGAVTAGQSQRGMAIDNDTGALGDLLAGQLGSGIFNGTGSLVSTATGHDVDVYAAWVKVTGAVEAGTASPAGNADYPQQLASSVRVIAIANDGAGPALSVGDVSANEDVGLQAQNGSVSAGNLSAGRDVAVASFAGLSLTSAVAGDDLILRAGGDLSVSGGLTSGAAQRGVPQDNVNFGLGDQLAQSPPLAIYDGYTSVASGGHDIFVSGAHVAITGDIEAGLKGASLDASQVGSLALITASGSDVGGVSALSLGTVSANLDVALDSTGATGGISTGVVTAGRDVAARSLHGDLTLAAAFAGDDIVLRAPAGTVDGGSALWAGQVQRGMPIDDSPGAAFGDQLLLDAPMSIFGTTVQYAYGGHDVNILGKSVTATGAIQAGDALAPFSGLQFGSSALIVATGADAGPSALSVSDVMANGDVGLQATNVSGSISAGSLIAGRDIAVSADHGSVGLSAALAGDDVVLRAVNGQVTVSGGVTAGQAQRNMPLDDFEPGVGDTLASLSPITLFGASIADASHRFAVNIAAQQVTVTGSTEAGSAFDLNSVNSDVLISATGPDTSVAAISLGGVSANRDIGLEAAAGSVSAGGQLTAGRDVAVNAAGGLNIAAAAAGDDVVLNASGAVSVGDGLTSGQGQRGMSQDDGVAGLGDQLAAFAPITLFGTPISDMTGGHFVSVQGSQVQASGATEAGLSGDTSTAGAGSSVLVAATGLDTGLSAISMGDVSANLDVGLDATAGGVSAGSLTAGRDVAVQGVSSGISVGSAAAGDDVMLYANGVVTVTGGLASGQAQRGMAQDDSSSGLGDLLASSDPFGLYGVQIKSAVGGHDVHVFSDGLQVHVSGLIEAGTVGDTSTVGAGSQAVVLANHDVSVGDISANQDIGIGTPLGSVTAGALTAGRDVAVRSPSSSINLGSATAGDDVVLRATGALTVTGGLTSGQAQRGMAQDDSFGFGDQLASVAPNSLFGTPISNMTGGHFVSIQGAQVQVSGSTEAGASSDTSAAGAGSSVLVSASGPDTGLSAISIGDISANLDVALDATAGGVSAGPLTAGRDVAAQASGGLSVASALAGDDVVLHAGGDLTVTGALTSGQAQRGMAQDNSSSGQGDQLAASDPFTVYGALADVTGGHDVSLFSSGQHVQVLGSTEAGAAGDTSTPGAGSRVTVLGVSGVSMGDIAANQDIGIGTPNGAIATGALTAGRDVGIRSASSTITLGSATAGDDVVLRAAGAISVTGGLTSGQAQRGMTQDDSFGLGDQLALFPPITLFNTSISHMTGGHNVNLQAAQVRVTGAIEAGTSGDASTTGAGSRVLIASSGPDTGFLPSISLGDVSANQDIGLDAAFGRVSAGVLTAGRDVAVRSSYFAISLDSVAAGDDIVLRAPSNQVTITGSGLASGQAQRGMVQDDGPSGLGDQLAALSPVTLFGAPVSDMTGGYSTNILAQQVSVSGAIEAGTSGDTSTNGAGSRVIVSALDTSFQAMQLGDVSANQDIALDSAGGVSAHLLVAGRDVAANASTSALRVDGVSAGDDIVLRAPASFMSVAAAGVQPALTSGHAQRGMAQDDGASGLGDKLAAASPMTLFGSSATDMTGGYNVSLQALGVFVGSTTEAGTSGAASDPLQAGSRVLVKGLNGSVFLQDVSANQDIAVDAGPAATADIIAGAFTAGRDVAVNGTGLEGLTSVAAGDDVVLRGQSIEINGGVTSGQAQRGMGQDDSALGLGDQLAAFSPITLFGTPISAMTGGHNINLMGQQLYLVGSIEAGHAGATSDPLQAGSRALLAGTAPDSSGLYSLYVGGDASANQDVALDGAGTVQAGNLTAGRDIAVNAGGALLQALSAQAGDDVVLRAAAGGIDVNGGALTSGQAQRGMVQDDGPSGLGDVLAKAQPITLFGASISDMTGGHSVSLSGQQVFAVLGIEAGTSGDTTAAGAGSRVMIAATGPNTEFPVLYLGDVSANQDIALEAVGGSVAVQSLTAGRDIAVNAGTGTVVALSAKAGDDVVLRAPSGSVGVFGALTSGQAQRGMAQDDGASGLGDQLALASPISLFGTPVSQMTGGYNVNLLGQLVLVSGATEAGASGDTSAAGAGSRVLALATGPDGEFQAALTMTDVSANQDVGLQASTGALSVGTVVAGRDLAASAAGGYLQLLKGTAGDDLVLRATAGRLTGGAGLTSGQTQRGMSIDDAASGLGDELASAAPISLFGTSITDMTGGHSVNLSGLQVITFGAIEAGTSGASDPAQLGSRVLVAAAGPNGDLPTLSLGAISANQDVGVEATGSAADIRAGVVIAGRDIAIRSASGMASVSSAAAGDDVVLRADAGTAESLGAITSGQAQRGMPQDDGVHGLGDTLAAFSPITLFGTPTTDMTGGYSVNVLGSRVVASSTVEAGQAGASSDPLQLGSRVVISASGPDGADSAPGLWLAGAVSANQDVALQASGTANIYAVGGMITAGRDLAVMAASGDLTILTALAGDDIVLRASAGAINGYGDFTTGLVQRGMPLDDGASGLGDRLAAFAPISVFGTSVPDMTGGHSVNLFANSVQMGGTINAGAPDAASDPVQAGSQVLVAATGADTDSGFGFGVITLSDVNANLDIAIDAMSTSAPGSVWTTGLIAGRDVAVNSMGGNVGVEFAEAGDDIVLRAPQGLAASEGLMTGLALGGATIDDSASGYGDKLALVSPISLFGTSSTDVTGGHDVSIVGQQVVVFERIEAGTSGASDDPLQVGSRVMVQATGDDSSFQGLDFTAVQLGDVAANQDIAIDATSASGNVTLSGLSAGRDVAVRSLLGDVNLTGAFAGDDVVIRSGGDLIASDVLVSGQAQRGMAFDGSAGFGDALAATSPVTFVGTSYGLDAGAHVDLRAGGGIGVGGGVTASGSGSDARFQAQGLITLADVTAGRDVLADGVAVGTGDLQAGRDLAIRASRGGLGIGNASAGDDVVLRAALNVSTGALTSNGSDSGAAGQVGDLLFSSDPMALKSGSALGFGGSGIDVKSASGSVSVAGAAASDNARFQAGGGVSLGNVTTGGEILADGTSVTTGALNAQGGDVAVQGRSGDVSVGSAKASDDVVIWASGKLTTGALASSTSGSGDGSGLGDLLYSLHEGAPSNQIGGLFPLTSRSAVFVSANQLDDLPGVVSGQAFGLDARGSGGLAIGGSGSPAAGRVTLGQSSLSNIQTPVVVLFSPTGDVPIGDAQLSSKVTSLSIYTPAKVTITGALLPAASATTQLIIGTPTVSGGFTPSSILVINDAGSSTNRGTIGQAPTSNGLEFTSDVLAFKSVELNANGDLLLGSTGFMSGLSGKTGGAIDQYVETGGLPATGPKVMLAAGSVTLRANGILIEENTSEIGASFTNMLITGEGVSSANPSTPLLIGVDASPFAVRLGRTDGSGSPIPTAVELFLSLKDGGVTFTNNQLAISPRLGFYAPTGPNQYYRVNSCVIGEQGNCTPLNNMIAPLPPTQSTVQLTQPAQPDVEDVTITGAANEEIWRKPN